MQCRMWVRLRLLFLSIGCTVCGCGGTTQTNGSGAIVKWNDIGTMVVAIQRPEGTQWYILEGSDSLQVAQGLHDNTVAQTSPSRTTQTFGGTDLRVFAFDKQGGQLHRFLVDFQYVEGMGDKRTPNPKTDLLQQGQSKRCSTVLSLVEDKGRPLSMVESDQYAERFQDVDHVFLYWRN